MDTNKKLFLITLGISIGLIVFGFRWTFKYKFDPIYWENYYYTSQWNVPNSQRIISDEGVYRYIGYRLVNGENPFNVDYWVPPFGKFMYGLSAKFLNNPYWTSWVWYILLLAVTRWVVKNNWVLLLVATNPLVVSQIGKTMLDLPQGVMLMIQIGFLIKGRPLLAGVALGLMMGIKIGYFGPMVAVVGAYYLYKKTHQKITCFQYLVAIPLGYIMSYFCYFAVHPNPLPWLRLHGKIIDFWSKAGVVPHPINVVGYILINKFNQVLGASRVWMTANEWSVVLPLSLMIIIKKWIIGFDLKNSYFLLLASGWLLLNTFIDFWPRYLVAIVPVLVIITVDFFKNKQKLLAMIFFINLVGLWMVLRSNYSI